MCIDVYHVPLSSRCVQMAPSAFEQSNCSASLTSSAMQIDLAEAPL